MRVALVHDWLTGMRGGERVLEVLCGIFPEADIFTLIHIPGSVSKVIEGRRIKTSFLQYLPFSKKYYRMLLPLFPLAAGSLDLSGYDLVVSTSHCAAKGVRPAAGAAHICYIFTPMRYIWDQYDNYFGKGRANALVRIGAGLAAGLLRKWDVTSSARVDDFIAISRHVAERVKLYYGRMADVIYPPVDCSRFSISETGPGDYYLIVSAFAPYKRIDIAVDAFTRLGIKLKIIGSGQDEARLKRRAGGNVEFLGWLPDETVSSYYSGCRALIFPGEEDFGIVPLEAMASGRPVIAYGRGGLLETVIPMGNEKAPTGIFFNEPTSESLSDAVERFESGIGGFSPAAIREHALGFDVSVFSKKITEHINASYAAHKVKKV